ncbi:efflux RND transporter periplasmic adaptor subunit [Neobacillus dielmonensis]|uniref:efflux RND transporter periplasmic adaptor subunit n=1 Tax=Neobacillus dielmonensis TaxID=1347369 RepID=UPI0005AAF77F|nr:HlyD family efflux transporter periplasmic adaptor subunit [Neobacillus dielmonensis]
MSKQKKKGKKKVVMWTMAGIITVMVGTGFIFTPKGANDYNREKAEIADITTYYSFSGTVEAKNRKTLMTEEAMQIKEVKIKPGDQVKEGDVLIVTKMNKKIKATMDGEITKVYAEKNAQLIAGAQLIDIVNYSALQTTVKVDEYDLQYLNAGQEVNVVINALEKDIKGTVASISKEAVNENGVSYFTATIDLAQDDAIKVGMSTEAKILKQDAKGITTLPMKAIQFDSKNKPYVLIPSEKGMPAKKYVETGISDGTIVEIKNGIDAGDEIMVSTEEDDGSEAAMMQGGM